MAVELSPADPASPWMRHLERAHALVHAAARAVEEQLDPSPYLAPAAEKLARGVTALYDAFDGRAHRRTAIGLAHARIWDAAVLVAHAGLGDAVAALVDACGELIAAEERYPRVPLAGRSIEPLRAGADLLPFHTLERASLAPAFRAPPVPEPVEILPDPEIPEPKTFAELRAAAKAVRALAKARTAALTRRAPKLPPAEPPAPEEAPPGFASPPPKAITEDDFVRRWARECIDEIGMIGMQRTPLLGDDWRTSLPLERRMVAAVDALAALGPVAIAHVEPYAMDAPAADPMRVFAVTLIGGCLEGRDALASAERVLHRFGPGDPPVAAAFVSAMKLAHNPFAPEALRSLLASGDPACRVIAAEVLAHRGWLAEDALEALAEDGDPRLLAIALPALATGRFRALYRVLPRALAHEDARVLAAALDAMAIAAHPDAAEAARAAASGPLGERALARLAIVADEADARWLLDWMNAAPTAASVEAVGWAGLVTAVPALISLLSTGEDEVKLAAGAALYRLLGAKILDTIEVMPEELDVPLVPDPDPEAKPERRPLAEIVSDRRDQPPPGSKEALEVPAIDPERWSAYWVEHGRSFDPRHRIRRGQAYTTSVSLYELDRLPLTPDERRRLHRELCARTGRVTHFDPHDFVVAQEQSLKAWEALVRATLATPGVWTRPLGT
jgi:hypothetical protein